MKHKHEEGYALLDALLALALITLLALPLGTLLAATLRDSASSKEGLYTLVSRRNEISCPSSREASR
ncbi:hypothetical protein B4O97_17085 [Marispirochaeta aestuarii]|uniref:Uncharacterized protein n=1 Tax=Marispirochaeta aestuarii TaxID=1963862 RepID=A0A1Y1RTV5_9SPIO|nr:hypothetical protein [Marispirochaeta aestuarii]ORC31227.1 hypothetical protein B4O97_17085 [Marispirochaeta aestuarii]